MSNDGQLWAITIGVLIFAAAVTVLFWMPLFLYSWHWWVS